MNTKRILSILFFLVVVAITGVRLFAASFVESTMNQTYPNASKAPVSEAAQALHAKLFVADLHGDPLLFGRNILQRSSRGHLDIPRMQEGNVALQFFSVVTKTPHNLNIDSNEGNSDDITVLAVAAGWPFRTWNSLKERTLYLGSRLRGFAEKENSGLKLIRNKKDFSDFLTARQTNAKLVGGLLSIEGLHALEGKIENINALDQAGFRLIGLAHFFDNEVAGSAHGSHKGGLTTLGRAVVAELERRSIFIDLAHSSAKTMDEVLAIATRPVFVSHTGVKGTCNNNRNLSDAQLKAVAAKGGIIGIGYWKEAVCGEDTESIARAIDYAVKIVGADHVGLGSDFDGTVTAPFDGAGMAQVTQALMKVGLDDKTIEAVMGGNVKRLLAQYLPD